jgi:endoglucanase
MLKFVVALMLVLPGCGARPLRSTQLAQEAIPPKYGKLQVIGTHLCDSAGKPVQLRGMSTMGLQWKGEIVNDAAFAALAKDWKADIVRLAMYVGEGGYGTHSDLKQIVTEGVELAVKHGLYAIIDWHVLTPGNPNNGIYRGARAFFDEMSRRYAGVPNVLYEIMNEPNGPLGWPEDLKPYAQKMVDTIRANDPDNVILIGSGTWSQEVNVAAADPVQGKNLMYTFHFYSGSHGEELRARVKAAIDDGAAVFCTEWGTTNATGGGPLFLPEAETWLAFLDKYQISWVNWSLCDKHEGSAALISPGDVLRLGKKALMDRDTLMKPETPGPDGYPIWGPDELTRSGTFVRGKLRAAAESAAAEGAEVSRGEARRTLPTEGAER